MPSTPPASRTRQDAAARRRLVLDEAQKIIGERGYHGFGIQELASRSGLTKAGLLHHFGSKEQLLVALLRARDAANEAEVISRLRESPATATDPAALRERILAALGTIVARNVAQPELMRLQIVLRAEAITPDHPAHDYFVGREGAKREVIAEQVMPFSAKPQATARRVLAVMTGLEEQWLRECGGFDLLAECTHALALLLPTEMALTTSTGTET